MRTSSSPNGSAKAIYLAAVDIADVEERHRLVHQSCGDDRAWREEVELPLAARDATGTGVLAHVLRQMNPRVESELGRDKRVPAGGSQVGRKAASSGP